MPKSISILSFAAALGLAGAAFAQDTTTEEPAAESAAETSTDAAADTATETGTAADAPAEADAAASEEGAENGTDNAFSTGTQVADEQPAVYVKEKFGDWSLRCFRNDEGEDPCQLYQLLREAGGNPVAEFSVFRIEGQAPAVAGATAIVPLVTLLTEELKLSVDGGTAKSYPYRVCTEAGCVAQMGLTQEDVDTFKRGATAQITLVPAQAPDQKVRIDVSLAGFTAGYEAVGEFTE
ncbi:invasion associated locus B family protein [Roseovarius sp. S4756]|uniref:invasion associated locus B family protein n=1 Tax=Roseovarius maritimus TaxID=3342637 RepID=UPI0037279020